MLPWQRFTNKVSRITKEIDQELKTIKQRNKNDKMIVILADWENDKVAIVEVDMKTKETEECYKWAKENFTGEVKVAHFQRGVPLYAGQIVKQKKIEKMGYTIIPCPK